MGSSMTKPKDVPDWFASLAGASSAPVDPGAVDDWAQFIGKEDATQMLAGLGNLSGSQALLEQLAGAILAPGQQRPGLAAGAGAKPPEISAEEKMRRAELRLRSLVDNLPCVAFVAGMGEGGNEVYINPYIEELLGYSRDEWLRDPFLWYWRLHPDDRDAWNAEFARGLVTGGPWSADCRFLTADGRSIWVRGHASIVRDDRGQPLFLQGIAFDITNLKDSEQRALAERDALRAELAALRKKGGT
jgi:PAS domain S-box-containing protein